jgi:hypothetical protein
MDQCLTQLVALAPWLVEAWQAIGAKKNKQIETTSHAQISTGRFESGNGRHGCDEKTDGLAQPR